MSDTTYQEIPLARLHESPLNPRKTFAKAPLDELAASIKAKGIIDPLIVRPNKDGFEIAAGHRRYRAAKLAGLEAAPALVRPMDDVAFLEVLTIENLQRQDLHPLEEADSFHLLLTQGKYDVDAVAEKIGKSISYVYASLRYRHLVKPVREAFLADKISAGHATDIARLQPDDQLEALNAATGRARYRNEPLSVRELRDYIQRAIVRDLAKAPFDTKDAALLPAAGACGPCPKRAANNPELFGEIAKGDRCVDGACFSSKTEAWLDGIRKKAREGGHKVVNIKTGWSEGKGLPQDQYQAAGKKECDDLAIGVVVATGYGASKLGDTMPICLKPGKCKVHNPKAAARSTTSSRSSASAPAKREPTLEERVDRKAFELVRHKIKTPLSKADLEVLVLDQLVYSDGEEVIADAYGWKVTDLRKDTTVRGLLAKLSANDLARLLLELAIAREIMDGFNKPILTELAKRYGIDLKKVAAGIKAEDAAKAKAAKPAKAVQTSAKAKDKK